nr:ribonuclease H-like domain-containing protein [Tanacetum cinerariifolium]
MEDFFGDTYNAVSLNDVKADLSNMETAIQVSPTPTFKIHKDHPKKPKKIVDAQKDPSWAEAMQHELLQFKIQNVWVLVDCPSEVRPIGMKWVLKNKKDERGIVIRNKARIVAQGNTQEEGIDYEEVFAPVARIEAIRLFLAYASYMGFTVYQMDVKSAFLYETINEEVYVMQPPSFQDPEFLHRVYKQRLPWIGRILGEKDGTGKDVELHLYRSMIRSLMYLTASRTDIMVAVCAYARHQVTPKECHLYAVKRIFMYIKGNPKLGLWYPKESSFDLVAFLDSDYGGANQDRKSTTRAASGCGEVLWIQNQLLDYGGSHNRIIGLEFGFVGCNVEVVDLDLIIVDVDGRNNGWRNKILAKVNGRKKTVSESSIRRHLKLNDEEGISTLPDNELFENLSLMGYNILPNQSLKRTSFNAFSSNIATALVCLATNRKYNFSKMILDGMMRNVKSKDETTFPTGDVRYEEAFPTDTSLDACQDRENIAKTSAMPLEALPRVTSRGGEAKFAQEDQIIREQAKRDSEIAKIHAEKELEMMIAKLDRSNKMVAKYLSEYEQAEAGLSHDEK